MSTTVDERVVEMRFDNKNFESNVATSMSTLEKLKHSLRLDGAAKGLQNLSSAAKNNNLDALGNSANTVGLRFNAMYTMADQALRNITTRVQHTAESMKKALTLDPITTGFREYETQMNAVQTILANTSSKGSTIQDVNAALKELNDYADLTIYNFTEMTRNIGTFTAAGIDLDTSVNAIQGIANLAAVSGSTSQQASTAMYQLSQALASGTVKLMDWNSVVNAGMGGEVFQNALKETSRLLGTGADAAIEAAGSFRESLSQGWLTSEVLTTTLRKFTTSGAAEYVAEYTGLTNEAVDAILESTDAWGDQADAVDKASEALAEQSGKSKDEIKAILDMAKTAQDAATKVKTFTQLWDVLKEAAQSGWAQTWQLIVGDFEEAKALLSPLADFFTGIIGSISDLRNNILRSALGKTFVNLTENVSGMLKPVEKTVEAISNVTNSLQNLDDIANRVIRGEFGNGQERFDALAKSGQNYCEVQNRVNELLGNGYRYTQEQIDAQNELLGTQRATTTATEESTEATSDSEEATVALTEAQKDQIKSLLKLSDEELRVQGYTDEQIASLDELRATYEKLGIPMEDFIDNIEEINGRWLLINSFKNIGQGLIGIFNSLKTAWQDVFPPKSIEERAESLFNLIAGFHKLTSTFANAIYSNGKLTETGENLAKTFKGLFAILDLVRTVVGGGLSIAFKVLSTVLGAFNLDILDVTASIGDALVSFRDWVLKENAFAKAIDELVGKLPDLIDEFRAWFNTFKETPAVQKLITAIEAIQSAFDKLINGKIDINEFASSLGENLALALKSLPEIAIQVGRDFIAGFQNGIDFSVSGVIDKIVNFCINFVNGFKEALGVQSPSWKAYETATDFFQGFINGASDKLGSVISVLKTIGEQIVKVFKSLWDFITDESGNIEWDKIFAGGLVASMIWIMKIIATAISGISNAFNGIANALAHFDDLIIGVGKVLNSFSEVLNGVAWDLKAKAILKMAIAIGILVAAIWVLTTIDDPAKLWQAVGVIAVLAAILIGLSIAMNKLASASLVVDANSKKLDVKGIQNSIIQIGIAILLLAAAVKMIGNMDPDKAKQGFIRLAGIAGGLIIFLAAMGGISRYSEDAAGVGKMLLKIGLAMGIMAFVLKTVSKMDPSDIAIGIAVLEAFVLLVIQMGIANRIAGIFGDNFGANVLKISIAMGVMALVMKILSGMDPGDILKGVAALQAFVILIGEMALINRLAGENQSKFGRTIMAMSVSLLVLTGIIWLLSKMNERDVANGIIVMELFIGVITEMILISKLAGEEAPMIAANILAMSVAIGILASVAIVLGLIDTRSLVKGIAAVSALGLVMSLMIASTKNAKKAKENLMAMTVVIAVMAAAVVALSFIDGSKLAGAVAALDSLMICFGIMTMMSSKVKNTKAMRKTLLLMIGIVVIMAGLIASLSLLDPKRVVPNALALSVLMVAFAATFKILNGVKLSKTVTKNLQSMVLVMAEIAAVLALTSLLPNPTNMIPSAIAIGILLNTLATSMLIMSKAKGNFKMSFVQLQSMALVIAEIGAVLSLMSLLPNPTNMIPSAIAIGILLNTLATSMLIMSKAKGNFKMSFVQLQSMALVIAEVGAVLGLMSFLPNPMNMIPSAIAIGILLNTLATSMLIMSKAKGNFKMSFVQLQSMALAMVEIAAILALMSFLPNPVNMIPSAIAIGILLNALAAALLIASFAGPNASSAASAMTAMSIALIAVGVVLGLMSAFNIEPSIETALSLSILMLALSAACLIVSLIPAGAGIAGAIQLAAFIGIMAAVIAAAGLLSKIPGFNELLKDGGEVLGLVGKAIGNFVGGIIAGIAGGVISILPQLGIALSTFAVGAQPFIDIVRGLDASVIAGAGYLTGAILALSAASFISGIMDILSLGQSSLPKLGFELSLFGTYAKAFFDTIKDVDATAIEAANNIANMILTLTASNLISTITEFFGGSSDFSEMGANLKAFGEAVVGFSDTISGNIDVAAVEAATNAGLMLVELNKALPRSGGFLQDLIGEQDFEKFSEACAAFAKCILGINDIVSQEGFVLESEKIEQLVVAGEQFSRLNNSLPRSGGIAQDLAGEQDLAGFGKACVAFATCMIAVNEAVSQEGFTIQSEKINQMVDGGIKFNELNTALPKTGGIAQDLAGEQDLAKFGQAVAAFAECMVKVNQAISQEGFSVNLEGMEQIKQAGLKMNEMQEALPKTGGWWQDIAGEKDIGDFGSKISTFAQSIVDFSNSSAELDQGAISNCLSTIYRIKSLMESLIDIDYSGVETFTGVGTGGFGADGPAYDIAQAMAAFSNKVSEIDTGKVSIAVTSAQRLKSLITSLVGLDTSGIENFKPVEIGNQIKSYSNKVSDINTATVSRSITSAIRLKNFIASLSGLDSSGIRNFKISSIGLSIQNYGEAIGSVNIGKISSSIIAANQLKSFIDSLSSLNTDGIGSFKDAINQLSTVNIDNMVKAFSGASSKLQTSGSAMIGGLIQGMQSKISSVITIVNNIVTSMNKTITSQQAVFFRVGGLLASNLATGISSKKSNVSSAVNSCLSNSASRIRDKYSSFYNAGSYLVTGFCNGITANTWRAEARARAMANAAERAAREALDINSPSKVFKEIGSGIPEGFAIGIGMLGSSIKRSVTDMTSNAIDATRSTMSTILNAISADVDAQPTIRPVIDLSDVKSGVNSINGLFGGVQSIGVRSNLNAVNTLMNRRLQNGTNDDIISAINKLNDGLSSNRGDTYNFGDFIYDDDNSISEAVQTLIRAARMGRRV